MIQMLGAEAGLSMGLKMTTVLSPAIISAALSSTEPRSTRGRLAIDGTERAAAAQTGVAVMREVKGTKAFSSTALAGSSRSTVAEANPTG